jgi:type IV pilus biogenesis protein CpaD/CtpE
MLVSLLNKGQVSIMFNLPSKTTMQCKRILAVIGLAASLGACAADDLAHDESLKPFGGSKQHPIKVANGKATVDGCGDWSENLAITGENTLAPNHGCAVQANIATMAAYPKDLVRARPKSKTPAFSRIAPINALASGAAAGGASAASAPAAKP